MNGETQENRFSPATTALRDYVDKTGETLASIGRKTDIERSLLSKLYHGKTLAGCHDIRAALDSPALREENASLVLVITRDAPVEELKARVPTGQ